VVGTPEAFTSKRCSECGIEIRPVAGRRRVPTSKKRKAPVRRKGTRSRGSTSADSATQCGIPWTRDLNSPAASAATAPLPWSWRTDRYCREQADERFPFVARDVCLDWPSRLVLLRERVAAADCDIVCLQELELETFDSDFGRFLVQLGYACEVHRPNRQKRTSPIGNAIAYRTATLVPLLPGTTPNKKQTPQATETKGRPAGAGQHVEARFLHLPTSRPVHVVCVHLQSNDGKADRDADVERATQLRRPVCVRDPRFPDAGLVSLVLGDFNAPSAGPAHELLSSAGFVEASRGPLFTCCVWSGAEHVARWWPSDHVYVAGQGVKATYTQQWEPDCTATAPSASEPSDHRMVTATVAMFATACVKKRCVFPCFSREPCSGSLFVRLSVVGENLRVKWWSVVVAMALPWARGTAAAEHGGWRVLVGCEAGSRAFLNSSSSRTKS